MLLITARQAAGGDEQLGPRAQHLEVGVQACAAEHADRALVALGIPAGPFARLPRAFQEEPLLRVHELGLARRVAEEMRVEAVGVVEHGARLHVARVGDHLRGDAGSGQLLVAEEAHRLDAGAQIAPETLDVARAREAAGHADDRDRLALVGRLAAARAAFRRRRVLVRQARTDSRPGGACRAPSARIRGAAQQARAAALLFRCVTAVDLASDGLDRRQPEQVRDRDARAQLGDEAGVHRQQFERVAAEIEEVVAASDSRQAQHVGPEGGDALLGAGARRQLAAAGLRRFRRGQGAAVHLAVGRERQRLQGHDGRRQHEVGKFLGQRGAQRIALRRHVARRHDVGDELLVARLVLAAQHHDLLHRALPAQGLLDLAQLDAEAAELDLLVDAPEELDGPVGAAAHEVPRAVQARARLVAEGMRHEALGRELGARVITERKSVAAEVKLSRRTDRHELPVPVEHVRRGVTDGLPDRHGVRIVRHVGHLVPRGVGRALRRPVDVQQVPRTAALQHRTHPARRHGLATEEHAAQRREDVRRVPHELVEQRRGHEEHGDALLAQRGRKVARRERHVPGNAYEACAVQQRAPDLEGGRIERGIGHLRDAVLARELHIVGAQHEARDAAVRDARALRLAGGARGVDEVGEVGRRTLRRRAAGGVCRAARRIARRSVCRAARRRARRLAFDGAVRVEQEHRAAEVRQLRGRGRVREQEPRPGVRQHEGDAPGRIFRVERHVGAARLEDAEQPHRQVEVPLERQSDGHVGAHAETPQVLREALRARVERRVAELRRAARGRDRVGRPFRLRLEELVQAKARRPLELRPAHDRRRKPCLGFVDQREARDGQRRRAHGGREKHAKGGCHALHRGVIEQVGVVEEADAQFVACRLHVDVEVEVGGAELVGETLDAQAGEAQRGRRRVLQREEHLEDRVAARVALGEHLLNEALEGQVLVLEGSQAGFAHAAQQRLQARVAAEIGAQREHVGEAADQSLELRAAALAGGHADDDVVLRGITLEQQLEAGEQGHEEAGAGCAAQRFQSGHQGGRQHDGGAGAVIGLLARARMIGRQLQRRHVRQRALPVVEQPAQRLALQQRGLPAREVGVLHRQCGE